MNHGPHAWIKKIKVGDVLLAPSGALRIVRRVSHLGKSIPRTIVYFTIQRCSWTGRCYTVINGNDLRQMRYQPTTATFPLNTKFDRLIAADFSKRDAKECRFHCCDVRGVA